MAVSQESIDSINDTIITQPKSSSAATSTISANEKILNGTISSGISIKQSQPPQYSSLTGSVASSSFDRSSIPTYASSTYNQQSEQQPPSVTSGITATYETYRPPISHERINPFDKNKTPVVTTCVSYSPYSSSPSTYTSVVTKDEKTLDTKDRFSKQQQPPVVTDLYKPAVTNVSGFDYSYKPANQPPSVPAPVFTSSTKPTTEKSIDKADEKPKGQFERKMSDADIIFGGGKVSSAGTDTSCKPSAGYSRNRSNSSFTSTSTDSDYIYGSRDPRRDNSFQKSLSVSSDKDGDFSHDPSILQTRSGISNDAFSDFDSPNKPTTTTSTASKLWSNNDDEFDLK